MESRQDRVDGRLDRIETRLDRISDEMKQFYIMLGKHEARLDNLEKK